VLTHSVIASPMVVYRGPFVLKMPDEAWFNVNMMQKDMMLAMELGRQVDVPLPTTAIANEYLTAARAMGLVEEDFATVFKVLVPKADVAAVERHLEARFALVEGLGGEGTLAGMAAFALRLLKLAAEVRGFIAFLQRDNPLHQRADQRRASHKKQQARDIELVRPHAGHYRRERQEGFNGYAGSNRAEDARTQAQIPAGDDRKQIGEDVGSAVLDRQQQQNADDERRRNQPKQRAQRRGEAMKNLTSGWRHCTPHAIQRETQPITWFHSASNEYHAGRRQSRVIRLVLKELK